MAKLSYKGTGRKCKAKTLSSDRSYYHPCKEDCKACADEKKAKEPPN